MEKPKKAADSISDKHPEVVQQELLDKAKHLYCRLQDNFDRLSKSAKTQHVKTMLSDFAEEAGRDCKELDSITLDNVEVNVETSERHFSIFDHLLSVEDPSLPEEERAIIEALKISDNMRMVFSTMAEEYKDEKLRSFFETLAKHEVHRKNELEQLYEELIVKGQW